MNIRCLLFTALVGFIESSFAAEIVFQQGAEVTVDGSPTGIIYSGAQDAEIREDAPAANFDGGTGGPGGTGGGDSELHIDGDTPGGSGQASQALFRFDHIFGNGPGQIPLESEITRAVLRLDIDTSGDRLALHTLSFPWRETTVTWDNAGSPGNGIDTAIDSTFEFTLDSSDHAPAVLETVEITAQLHAYRNDIANHAGWGLLPSGPRGVDIDTHHHSDASPDGGVGQRPALIVTFTPPLSRLTVTESPGGEAQVDIIAPTAAPVLFDLYTSPDLEAWTRLTTLPAPLGVAQFIDPLGAGDELFYRAAAIPQLPPIQVLGSAPILVQAGFVPGSEVFFDIDGDTFSDHSSLVGPDGLLTVALDLGGLAGPGPFPVSYFSDNDGVLTAPATFDVDVTAPVNPANAFPTSPVPEPFICACEEECPDPSLAYTGSYTPTVHDVELFTGKVRKTFDIHSFPARGINFDLKLFHASLVQYDGPVGCGFSHSYNLMITRFGPNTGAIVTPNLRVYQINSPNGIDWDLPDGFFSRLTLDPNLHRWTLTHFSGRTIQFYEALQGQPGRPVLMKEPNGNTLTCGYDPSGLLTTITTPLGQVQSFTYDPNGLLVAFRNHLSHTWRFSHAPGQQLQQISRPPALFVNVPPNSLLDDTSLGAQTVFGPRNIQLQYGDPAHPCHLTEIIDGRGALVQFLQYAPTGEVMAQQINGFMESYDYGAGGGGPAPLATLDPGNTVTRVVDRDQNIRDYEIHGPGGGPLGKGAGGLRRKVTFTETAKGNPALRPGEPDFYEQRILHDCDCLRPAKVAGEFSNADPVVFDPEGIPVNWPRREVVYNPFRQPLTVVHTDGVEEIRTEHAYQALGFGDNGEYSLRVSRTDPRQFDTSGLYSGLGFLHTYLYDTAGNCLRHDAPTVTRGTTGPQSIVATWTYNSFGQVTSHTDANGNRTEHTYFSGLSTGGDATTRGAFGGYCSSTTRGAAGSSDGPVSLTTHYAVNALGTRTACTDPNGHLYTWDYNDAGECVRTTEPPTTLSGGGTAQYETRYFYDGNSNRILDRRTNIDETGNSSAANPFIDHATAYDNIGNVVAEASEENESTFLVTQWAYDPNDRRIVEVKPEGNRQFTTYDERDLVLRVMTGVSSGANPLAGYPASDADTTPAGPTFVAVERFDYDGRRNVTSHIDGRGHTTTHVYDFHDRRVATSDQNGNGEVCAFDDASNRTGCSRGAVDPSGLLLTESERIYHRYDELGREYQRVYDFDLPTDESTLVDPDDGTNSSFRVEYDAGSRIGSSTDPEGNATTRTFDAADRLVAEVDALGNSRTHEYDSNDNLVRVTEGEIPGPGLSGVGDPVSEVYVTTFQYDELNRVIEEHVLGLDGTSVNHETFRAYDSRNNLVLIIDAEDQATRYTYDDINRLVVRELFSDSALTTRLDLTEFEFDGNDNKAVERNFSDESNPVTAQDTTRVYDDLDRLVRIVHPDSAGAGDWEDFAYDANSNRVSRTGQRGVITTYAWDDGNRLTDQVHTLAGGAVGNTRCQYTYDDINRLVEARNDFAEVLHSYDPLSRRVSETQSIRLDGTGFGSGYQFPMVVTRSHDRQSNQTGCAVKDGARTDLVVTYTYDDLNRLDVTAADYLGTGPHTIADYDYYGPRRVGTLDYGNGAGCTSTFDTKPRISGLQWKGAATPLVGGQYDYDDVDNPLYEGFTHDANRYDHYGYNRRYEITGADYRSGSATPPAVFPSTFTYDGVDNRTAATFGDPFAVAAPVMDFYLSNPVNEYRVLNRSTAAFLPLPGYDPAGNATTYPVLPLGAPTDVPGTIRYDANNNIFDFDTPVNPQQHYRYDPHGRRVATGAGPGGSIVPVRRFIYDGSNVVSERIFNPGATMADAPSTLDRVYVCGTSVDERFLCAIDGDQDRTLVGNAAGKNVAAAGADQEIYFLTNRLGSVIAVSDADDSDNVLEYYRYDVYGGPTAVAGLGPADTADQTLDNNLLAGHGRVSQFGNPYLFTGRRWDPETGLYYQRHRYYDPRSGRFLQRDPIGTLGGLNLYAYVENRPTQAVDPFGLNPIVKGAYGYVKGRGEAAAKNYARKYSLTKIVKLEQGMKRLDDYSNSGYFTTRGSAYHYIIWKSGNKCWIEVSRWQRVDIEHAYWFQVWRTPKKAWRWVTVAKKEIPCCPNYRQPGR